MKIDRDKLRAAILETISIHEEAEAEGKDYYTYKEDNKLTCPLCNYDDYMKEQDFSLINCESCPWIMFNKEDHCDSEEYQNYKASINRLNSWLKLLDELEKEEDNDQ